MINMNEQSGQAEQPGELDWFPSVGEAECAAGPWNGQTEPQEQVLFCFSFLLSPAKFFYFSLPNVA